VFIGGNNFGVNGWKPVIWRSKNGGQDWENVLIGTEDFDSFRYLWIDPLSGDQTIYAAMGSQVAGALYKSTDGGDTWTVISGTIPGTQLWYGAIISDSTIPDKIIASSGGSGTPGTAWISNNAGATWNSTYLNLDSYSKIPDLAINPSVSDVVYAASLQDGVSISTNGGMTWATANSGLPAANVTGFSSPWPLFSGWEMFASTFTNSIYRTILWDPAQGTEDLKGNSGLSVYPNPSDGEFTIRAKKGNITGVEIFNALGVSVGTFSANTGNTSISVDLSAPEGIYLGKVMTGSTLAGSVRIFVVR
jgi:hypothetical protein